MPKPLETPVITKTHRAVGVYLFLSIGLIVGTVLFFVYLFSGK